MSAKNRKKKSDPLDRYYTPAWLVDALVLEVVGNFIVSGHSGPLRVLDPSAGHGEFVDSIRRNFPGLAIEVTEYDIDPKNPRIQQADFLKIAPDPSYDLIISNPPFTYAMEFVQHAMRFLKNEYSMVMYLMRINWLGSGWRAKWIRENPPKSLLTSPRRPSYDGKGTDSTEYSGFAWADICYLKPFITLHTEDSGKSEHPLYLYTWPDGMPYKGWPIAEIDSIELDADSKRVLAENKEELYE